MIAEPGLAGPACNEIHVITWRQPDRTAGGNLAYVFGAFRRGDTPGPHRSVDPYDDIARPAPDGIDRDVKTARVNARAPRQPEPLAGCGPAADPPARAAREGPRDDQRRSDGPAGLTVHGAQHCIRNRPDRPGARGHRTTPRRRAILSATGPSPIMNTTGKMNATSGSTSCVESLCAASRDRWSINVRHWAACASNTSASGAPMRRFCATAAAAAATSSSG